MQNALNAQRVNSLVKTAETMGILDTTSEESKQADIDEILGFLTALEKVRKLRAAFTFSPFFVGQTREHEYDDRVHGTRKRATLK